jgi:hypothetical protein
MITHRRWMVFWAGLALLSMAAASPQRDLADMGPKPTMEFSFDYHTSSMPSIVSGILEECYQADCSDAQPLMKGGPQHFSCSSSGCDSLAYDYSRYHRLRIEFSDGKTRQSNIFEKKFFYASYSVTVRDDDLLVEEGIGEFAPFFTFEWILICGGVLLAVGFLVSIILLMVVALRGRRYEESRRLYKAVWIISLPTAVILLLASMFTGMILVLAAETAIAIGYAAWRKRSMALVLTVMLLLDVITLPVAAVFVGGILTTSPAWVLGTVVGICLLDAGFLVVAMRKEARFLEALLFGLILNTPVFVLALLSTFLQALNSAR